MPGRVAEFAAWWAVGVGIWLASLSAWSSAELLTAAVASAAAAAVAVAARQVLGGRWRPPAALLTVALRLPPVVVADTVRVLALAFRRRHPVTGTFRVVQLRAFGRRDADGGSGTGAEGEWAVATLVASATPGTYILDVDPRTGRAVIHAVLPMSPVERAIAR
jgi:multisubunit Na+/H+ antiporter MnhE subunit